MLAILLVCQAAAAAADQHFWNGNGNSNKFSDPNNWDDGFLPRSHDDLIFRDNASSVVNDLSNLVVTTIYSYDDDCTISGNPITIEFDFNNAQSRYSIEVAGERHVMTVNCDLVLQSDASLHTGLTQPDSLDRLGANDLHLNGNIELGGFTLTCRAATAAYPHGGGDFTYGYGDIYYGGSITGTGNVSVYSDTKSYNEFNSPNGNFFRGTLTIGADSDGGVMLAVQDGVVTTDALVVRGAGFLRLGRPEQIGNFATVTVQEGATFTLNNYNETFSRLVLNSTAGDPAPAGFDTGAGTLTLFTNIDCYNDQTNASLVTGAIKLSGGTHNFNVWPYFGSVGGGLDVQALISGSGGITKAGSSPLGLDRANTFDGNVSVTAGTVYVRNPTGLGSGAGTTTLVSGTLDISSVTVSNMALVSQQGFIRGTGSMGWGGPINVPGDLYAYNDGSLTLSGAISGGGFVTYEGQGPVHVTGSAANTFNGTTRVWNNLTEFDKPSGVKAFSGPLVVGTDGLSPFDVPACEARWINNYQGLDSAVSVYRTGTVNINNFVEEFSTVQMTGGLIETSFGQLGISQSVTSAATNVPAIINGYLYLAPVTSTLTVADGAADPDLQINAVVSGASTRLIKQGPGTLVLSAANAYIGDTLVSQGILEAQNAFALGTTSTSATVQSNATLRYNLSGSSSKPLSLAGSGAPGTSGALEFNSNSSFTLNGTVTLSAPSTVGVGQSGGGALNGVVTGTGPLTKAGPGSLSLSGSSANNYTGDTIVTAGFLNLSKSANVAAVPGNLVIGPALTSAGATLFNSGQMGGDTVTVNQNCLLNLNGNNLTLARLNLNDGGNAQTGGGSLNFLFGGFVSVGSLSFTGSRAGSSITGTIGLPANATLTFGVNAYGVVMFPFPTAPELDLSATIFKPLENASFSPAGIEKTGLGGMRLTANNGYKGATVIDAGTLEVDGSQPGSAVFLAGGTLSGTGTVGGVFPNAGSASVSPGHAGPGILVCSNFNTGASGPGILQIELNGVTAGSSYDQLDCKGPVNLSGITLNASLNFASNLGNHFTIINNESATAVTGTFSGLAEGASLYIGGERFSITYLGGTGNDVILTRLATPPKPTLAVQKVAPSSVRLSWDTNFPGFTLQSSTNAAPTTWSNVSPSPLIVGTNYVVTNAAALPHQLFRLKQ